MSHRLADTAVQSGSAVQFYHGSGCHQECKPPFMLAQNKAIYVITYINFPTALLALQEISKIFWCLFTVAFVSEQRCGLITSSSDNTVMEFLMIVYSINKQNCIWILLPTNFQCHGWCTCWSVTYDELISIMNVSIFSEKSSKMYFSQHSSLHKPYFSQKTAFLWKKTRNQA